MQPLLTVKDLSTRYAGLYTIATIRNWLYCTPPRGPRAQRLGTRVSYQLDDVVAWEAVDGVTVTPLTPELHAAWDEIEAVPAAYHRAMVSLDVIASVTALRQAFEDAHLQNFRREKSHENPGS